MRRILIAAMALCGTAAQAAPLTSDRAGTAIYNFLSTKQLGGGSRGPCSNWFDVYGVQVMDRRTTPQGVSVDAIFHAVAKKDVMTESIATNTCYGNPTRDRIWRAGQAYQFRMTFHFEQWDSGWKLKPKW